MSQTYSHSLLFHRTTIFSLRYFFACFLVKSSHIYFIFHYHFPDPCFTRTCNTFSRCVAKADDSTVCECQRRCSELSEMYFCGNDGRSYKYPCGDRLKTCPTIPGVGWSYSAMCGKDLRFFKYCIVLFYLTKYSFIFNLYSPNRESLNSKCQRILTCQLSFEEKCTSFPFELL